MPGQKPFAEGTEMVCGHDISHFEMSPDDQLDGLEPGERERIIGFCTHPRKPKVGESAPPNGNLICGANLYVIIMPIGGGSLTVRGTMTVPV